MKTTHHSSRFKSMRDPGRKAAQQRLDGSFESRLHDARPFDHSLKLRTPHRKAAKKLLKGITDKSLEGEVGKRRVVAFNILCANLLRRGKLVSISMSPNHWTKSRYRRAGHVVLEIIASLEEHGLIGRKRGYNFPGGSARQTRIWSTKTFLQHFSKLTPELLIESEPVELVILHNDRKKEIDYKDTKKTKRIRRILQQANEVNRSAQIIDEIDQKVDTDLHAVFNVAFDRGGRLYHSGSNHFQKMPEDERTAIKINGNRVVELDYSAFHPRILYAMEGAQFPVEIDPYMIIYQDGALRGILKNILLFALGCDDRNKAVSAGNKFLYDNYDQYRLMKRKGLTIKEVISKFEEAHEPIKHYFYRDTAGFVQNRDYKMALDILSHFTSKGIPCLPVHDSFIVEEQYEAELRNEMDEVFKARNNGFSCPIERS